MFRSDSTATQNVFPNHINMVGSREGFGLSRGHGYDRRRRPLLEADSPNNGGRAETVMSSGHQ